MASPYYFESTTYWSSGDEDAHFAWMKTIAGVRGLRGEGRKLFLDIDQSALTDESLRELRAVYRRYGGDLSQLEVLGPR